MATYVLADVHGELERFRKMMDVIGFSPDDTLYILGDVIDRGADGIALLQEIREQPNIRMLRGNHEDMMLHALAAPGSRYVVDTWMGNGGRPTERAFRMLPEKEQEALYQWVLDLPLQREVTVYGQTFVLVHAWLEEDDFHKIWGRPESLTQRSSLLPEGAKLIIGHTPVAMLLHPTGREQEKYFRELERTGGHMEILHTPGYINIDCGCGYVSKVPGAALACLRLEDMAEFYV